MSAWAERSIAAFAECLFVRDPLRPDPLYRERIDAVSRELVDLLRLSGPRARRLFFLCLFGVTILGPLAVLRLSSFRGLPLPLRVKALSRLEGSALAAPLVLAVKAAVCVVYYEEPAAAREIGAESFVSLDASPPPRGLPLLNPSSLPQHAGEGR